MDSKKGNVGDDIGGSVFNRDDGVGDVVGDGGDDDNVGDDSGGVQCPAEMMVIAVCQEARCHPAVPASQKTVHHNEEEDKDNKDKEEEEDNDDKEEEEEAPRASD